jgi:pimeloyl-ACP methyl ester carboxylesterase
MAILENPVVLGEGRDALHGTLAVPADQGVRDAVLIWSGSGPTDRDGNSALGLMNNSLKMLAQALAEAGYVSVRTDKRGVGASALAAPPEIDHRFETCVEDAVRWAGFLKELPRIRNVFLLGHSEGALIATMAAQRFRAAGLLLIAGTGFRAPDILRRQIASPEVVMAEALLKETHKIIDALERGDTVPEISAELHAAYRPSVQPYLISWFKYDPVAELTKTSLPTMVIQGSTDFQVSMEDAERLKAARNDIRLVAVEGMNHILKTAPVDRQDNYATYFKPMLPLSSGLLPPVINFLNRASAANDR